MEQQRSETEQLVSRPIAGNLSHFAWRVAGPRDFAINFIINGAIAWLLYHALDRVPWAGDPSVLGMLLPMTFILSSATTFFGYFNGVRYLRQVNQGDSLSATPWAGKALRAGLWRGFCGLLLVGAAAWLVHRWKPDLAFFSAGVICGLALYAGILGYVLHATAVLQAAKLYPTADASSELD